MDPGGISLRITMDKPGEIGKNGYSPGTGQFLYQINGWSIEIPLRTQATSTICDRKRYFRSFLLFAGPVLAESFPSGTE